LSALGNYGAFTGVVATVTGVAGPGQVQIANGDAIEVDYFDSTGTKRVATAVADIVPSMISGVAAATEVGVLTITWQTSEPATSIVRYGTNSSNLNLGVTNTALVTSHVVKLSQLIPDKTYYFLIVSADAAGNVATDNNSGALFTFVGVATPTVLLVDAYDTAAEEANGATVIPDGAYTNVLTSAGISYGFWKVTARGGPQLADLTPFPVVIWRTTDDIINYGVDADGLPDPAATNNTLNAQQQFMIQSYLNGGGSFFMASMGILSQLGDTPFRRNALRVAGLKQNPDPPLQCSDCDEDFGVPAVLGAPASVASGMSVTLDYSSYPSFDFDEFSLGPDFSDTFTPSSDATAITLESASGKPCGMSYPNIGVDSPGRVVFLSFPFDTIPTNGAAPNNAVTLLRDIVSFLAPGANGQGVVFLDNTLYTTNDVLLVEVGDSDLAGTGQTQISFVTSSRTNRTTVALLETTHPGLFRGTLTLVGGNPDTNQLQVADGDTITATYFDESNNRNVTATAGIDTRPPVISQVAANTDYYNANVTWLTSKPADSAVQYGDLSQPPANVAFVSALVTNHSVTIGGLLANRTYRYQVVSRDQAGNTTLDDNNGNLYTFQTLKAPSPPWFDDLESGAPGWKVVPDPVNGSDINWTLGTPNNGLAASAHSGTNAWGSDLNGDQNFFLASSFLYSPVIDLSGLVSATLTFWDVHDFSRVDPTFGAYEEDGGVLISTNSSTPPSLNLPLGVDFAGDVADTWKQETVDLTPWVGQTIQVVFYYQGFAFGDTIYGWTFDDVSITGVGARGNVNISKNIEQGTYSLFSLSPFGLVPVQSGVAPSVTISNLPAAQYVLRFGDVPYYQTPADLTNTLTAGGTVNFAGNYTFLDANTNGISDSWERNYFSSASTNRTQLTDTDGDGATDFAEFIAGTDPTSTNSVFAVPAPAPQGDGSLRFTWPSVPGRAYRVLVTTDLVNWTPATDWVPATGTTTSLTLGASGNANSFYRFEVRP